MHVHVNTAENIMALATDADVEQDSLCHENMVMS